jgi:ubiquinone/menaquinone biosynthesis C-methylase UbiE
MYKLGLLVLLIPFAAFAQKKDKVDKIDFCGVQLKTKENIAGYYKEQFDFLKVADGDTIVDIGAGSGWYEGAFSAVSDAKDLNFILVDINLKCLNEQKIHNMLVHYSSVKGDSIRHSFQIVQNTTDSLWLPLNRFKKIWMLNTLHEIPDQGKMIRDIHAVLKEGGEIVILENPPKKEGQLHGGCKKPLLSFEQIKTLFTSNGFLFAEKIDIIRKRNSAIQMLRFVKP